MKLEEIKNKTKEATDYLVASLEAGHLPSRNSFAVGLLSVAREAVQPPPKSAIKSMEQTLRFILTSKTVARTLSNVSTGRPADLAPAGSQWRAQETG